MTDNVKRFIFHLSQNSIWNLEIFRRTLALSSIAQRTAELHSH